MELLLSLAASIALYVLGARSQRRQFQDLKAQIPLLVASAVAGAMAGRVITRSYRDVATRFNLRAQSYRDAAMRFHLRAPD